MVYTYIAVYVLTFSLLTCLADQVRMPCARRQRQVISLTNNQMPHWMSCAACVGTTFGLRLRAHCLRPPDVPKYRFVDKVPNAKRHPEKARHAMYSEIGTTPQMQNEHLQSKDDVPYLVEGYFLEHCCPADRPWHHMRKTWPKTCGFRALHSQP